MKQNRTSSKAEQCCCWQQCFWDYDLCRCVTAQVVSSFFNVVNVVNTWHPTNGWWCCQNVYTHSLTILAIAVVLEWNGMIREYFFRVPSTHTHTRKLFVVALLCTTKCRIERTYSIDSSVWAWVFLCMYWNASTLHYKLDDTQAMMPSSTFFCLNHSAVLMCWRNIWPNRIEKKEILMH